MKTTWRLDINLSFPTSVLITRSFAWFVLYFCVFTLAGCAHHKIPLVQNLAIFNCALNIKYAQIGCYFVTQRSSLIEGIATWIFLVIHPYSPSFILLNSAFSLSGTILIEKQKTPINGGVEFPRLHISLINCLAVQPFPCLCKYH